VIDDKERILLLLKERWIKGEISKERYEEMKAELLAGIKVEKKELIAEPFDEQETVQGVGLGSVLLGRYEIEMEIGRGGMGVVYKAKDIKLDIDVAIKILREDLARDGRAIRNLKEEARIAMGLSHPHIMRLHTFDEDGHRKFLVMEYIKGETLKDRLEREGKLKESEVIALSAQICDGLDYAHREKVIHRDIKPSNVMVTERGEVKILDFGIARVAADSMTRITGQATSGTLVYMSPEQIRGKDVDLRSDIYALGIMLYELLTGNPPFSGVTIEHQHLHETPEPMGDVSPRLNEIVLKCLEKGKDQRFQSAEEMKAVLEGRLELDSERAAREAEEKRRRDEALRREAEEKARREEDAWEERRRRGAAERENRKEEKRSESIFVETRGESELKKNWALTDARSIQEQGGSVFFGRIAEIKKEEDNRFRRLIGDMAKQRLGH